ncbi:flagellar biosynthesis regulator FlaF [Caenispirillum bisanense]|uniref:flagellar biosynthesis regulator FlaF n=1 Tax=Caenispirillum bisanense TaxID=414052 RepID=UPI0031DAB1F4
MSGIGYYNTARQVSEDPRDREYRLFIAITSELERNKEAEYMTAALGHALHDNQRLWSTLMDDLMSEGNQLPQELRAQLISLGVWVIKHTAEINAGRASVEPLIDVNRMIIRGLAPGQQQQASQPSPQPQEFFSLGAEA